MSQDFWAPSTEHRAAKRHRCIWCGEHIEQGERHCRQSGVFYGEFQTNRWHLECWDAAEFSVDDEFMPHENERPLSAAAMEFASWDCVLLLQGRLL